MKPFVGVTTDAAVKGKGTIGPGERRGGQEGRLEQEGEGTGTGTRGGHESRQEGSLATSVSGTQQPRQKAGAHLLRGREASEYGKQRAPGSGRKGTGQGKGEEGEKCTKSTCAMGIQFPSRPELLSASWNAANEEGSVHTDERWASAS